VKEASWEADWEPFDNSLKAPKCSLHEVLIGIGIPGAYLIIATYLNLL
jgi:hypothetical protein